jgi:HSP20 family protein
MSNLLTRDRSNVNGGSLFRPFADLWSVDPFRSFSSSMNGFSGVEVARTETGYTVEMPVAGFKPEDVEVTLEDGLLTVSAKNEKRQFTRALTVPEEVDAERIEANVEHGMLILTLNLLPKAQPKKIEVKSR